VVAHETSHCLETGHEVATSETYALYECADGFRGSEAECLAHEALHGLEDNRAASQQPTAAPESLEVAPQLDRVLFRIYEADVSQAATKLVLLLCTLYFFFLGGGGVMLL
jgi:hypothetical protein